MTIGRICIALLLFSFALPLAGQSLSNPTKLYTGHVISANGGEHADGGMIYVYEEPYPEHVTSSKITTDGGDYRVILDPEKIYRFTVLAPGFYTEDFIMSTPSGTTYEELVENFEVTPIAVDSILYDGNLFVESGVELASAEVLTEILQFLDRNALVTVAIDVGLVADEVDPLSKQRVDAIKDAFKAAEVSTTRIKWNRDLSSPMNRFVIRISGFLSPS